MTFDPEQNRIPTGLLTADERAVLGAAKHGWQRFLNGHWWESLAPLWEANAIYRAKPAPAPTIIVNGIKVPEPVREALRIGQRYWATSLTCGGLAINALWSNDPIDQRRFKYGLIHLTEEAAVAHAKAMLAPSMRGMCDGRPD